LEAEAEIELANLNEMLTMAQINEIFDSMRATTRQLRDDYCGNGQTPPATTDVANIVSSFGD
jgi:hypothetical protein